MKLTKTQMKRLHEGKPVKLKAGATHVQFGGGFDFGKFFTRDLPSGLIHTGIPVVASALGGVAGETLGPVGAVAGNQVGDIAGNKLADYIGEKTGYGFRKIA
jgi:hypothetical protein